MELIWLPQLSFYQFYAKVKGKYFLSHCPLFLLFTIVIIEYSSMLLTIIYLYILQAFVNVNSIVNWRT